MKKILFWLVFSSLYSYSFAAQTATKHPVPAGVKAVASATTKIADSGVIVNIPCEANSACAVVSETTRQLLAVINQDSSADQIQSIVAPQFDFVLMTRYALGNNWKLANPDQQAQLSSLFRQLLIYTYSTAISKFKGAQITILSADTDERKAAVVSKVVLPNSSNSNQPVKVEYDLAKLPGSNAWKAYDIKIENASLVTTYRNQFNEVIQSSKIDGLIKQLQTKIAGLEKAKSE